MMDGLGVGECEETVYTDDDDSYSSPLHLLDIPMLLLLALEMISSRAGMRTM